MPLLQQLEKLPSGWLGRLHNASGLGLIALAATPSDTPGQGSEAQDSELADTLGRLRSHCAAHKGYLTILQAPPSLDMDPWGYGGNALGTMKAVKEQFDPHGLLNSGRFVGGI